MFQLVLWFEKIEINSNRINTTLYTSSLENSLNFDGEGYFYTQARTHINKKQEFESKIGICIIPCFCYHYKQKKINPIAFLYWGCKWAENMDYKIRMSYNIAYRK